MCHQQQDFINNEIEHVGLTNHRSKFYPMIEKAYFYVNITLHCQRNDNAQKSFRRTNFVKYLNTYWIKLCDAHHVWTLLASKPCPFLQFLFKEVTFFCRSEEFAFNLHTAGLKSLNGVLLTYKNEQSIP